METLPALVLAQDGDWPAAAAEAARAAARSLDPAQRRDLALAYGLMGRHEEALAHAALAARDSPSQAPFHYVVADLCRHLGRLEVAEAAYGRVLELDPDHALAHAALARLRRWTPGRNHVTALHGALGRARPGSLDAARLAYALFKELDDLDDPAAGAVLAAASGVAAALNPYDAEGEAERTDAIIGGFSAGRLQTATMHRPDPPRPIFIFGLPRSGTTLVERILGAHPRVQAMGETLGMPQAVKNAARTPTHALFDIPTIRAAAVAGRAEIARGYQQATAHLSGGAPVVTDKLPGNHEYVGAIRLAFPQAGLVHVRRAPMDSLFGAYRLMFAPGGYPWSYSLPALAAHYRQYRRLMDHWRGALGPAFVEVSLETLTLDPGERIPELLASVGLPFDPACLTPEKSGGAVTSESATQVRQPINRQGVGAWRRYARQLEPLRAELERDGFVGPDGEPV